MHLEVMTLNYTDPVRPVNGTRNASSVAQWIRLLDYCMYSSEGMGVTAMI